MMRSTPGDGDLIRKKASFIQHSLPGLAPGRYQIEVQQSLSTADGTDVTAGGLPTLTRRFGVAGPRFALSQRQIHSVFPPPNSTGEFSGSFAHVVLETEKLPWLRTPYQPQNEPPDTVLTYRTVVDGMPVDIHYDADRASWLGVVLLSPSDLDGADPSRRVVQGTVLDLIPGSLTATTASGAAVHGHASGQRLQPLLVSARGAGRRDARRSGRRPVRCRPDPLPRRALRPVQRHRAEPRGSGDDGARPRGRPGQQTHRRRRHRRSTAAIRDRRRQPAAGNAVATGRRRRRRSAAGCGHQCAAAGVAGVARVRAPRPSRRGTTTTRGSPTAPTAWSG